MSQGIESLKVFFEVAPPHRLCNSLWRTRYSRLTDSIVMSGQQNELSIRGHQCSHR